MMSRLCFASALVLAVVAAPVAVQAQASLPPVTVTGITINSVTSQAGQLVANATVTLDVVGKTITQNATIPLTLSGSPGVAGSCPILNLTLGPIHLDLLGLIVDVDNCSGGPITVSITGQAGSLVCSIAGLLNGGTTLTQLLALLNLQGTLGTLETTLTSVLNSVFTTFFQNATVTTGSGGDTNGVCDILELMVGPINLNVPLLGLVVKTSAICVSVTAQPGPGNLLGNLLCSLEDLLNNSGNTAHAQTVLVRNILRVLSSLGL